VSLVRRVIGTPCHWFTMSLVCRVIGLPCPLSAVSFVCRVIGLPCHWSAVSLVQGPGISPPCHWSAVLSDLKNEPLWVWDTAFLWTLNEGLRHNRLCYEHYQTHPFLIGPLVVFENDFFGYRRSGIWSFLGLLRVTLKYGRIRLITY